MEIASRKYASSFLRAGMRNSVSFSRVDNLHLILLTSYDRSDLSVFVMLFLMKGTRTLP